MKKLKNKKAKTDIENYSLQLIDVSGKRSISVIHNDIDCDDTYLRVLEDFANINSQIKSKYYSSNIAIKKTMSRTFVDLVKIYIHKSMK